MKDLSVSIIIPYYNTKGLLLANLPKVIEAKEVESNAISEIIVVDDGSPVEKAAGLKERFPSLKIITHKVNRGFSAAVNTGVRMAKGSLVALINTDVAPSREFLQEALKHFEDERVFAVSFKEKDYSWAKGDFKQGFLHHSPGPVTGSSHLSLWASGGSAVFRRKTWLALGGMDEKLFSPFYWEDIDLSYRAYKRGYKVIWEPAALVEHHHESTISTLNKSYTQRIRQRNELLFIWKNITSQNLFRKHLSALFSRMARHPGYTRIVLSALLKLGTVVKARRKERKEAQVSDEAIFSRFAT
ncbi:hypothetical protein A2V61_04365 [Candidatus Woesebacteria bacterium RBG_19FT_COMBO_47_8]|uniref:Glycosyltransferase 2-like domain-containing protein n=1 Tax=Candidatus Woesebacteria bacterium RBG_13_46_13 TaxID=1802479 RepID=A0A1F7X544_9BACT|nr:MAG: hypothetical protein A2Y68_00380 [Candidatus Woesebacteria bacterium RBG_13_46_13]OGM16458.1 MAG: hypothetical protein A2V61_04365 [Candidatus Woesebacteria bacterium RBG_19FT_COMBO_47_8]HJX59025.1 glycosyltransferase family 2 protein [Patescibacteria group bacterium]